MPRIRVSVTDWLVLLATAGVTAGMWRAGVPLWWLLAVVVAHFFLFCNVFLVPRRLELVWAGSFVLNVTAWMLAGRFEALPPLLCQVPVTLGVIGWTVWRRRKN